MLPRAACAAAGSRHSAALRSISPNASLSAITSHQQVCHLAPAQRLGAPVLCMHVLQDLHTRLQPLLIFTIDGANYIDAADPKWEIVAAVLHAEGKQQQLVSGAGAALGCISVWTLHRGHTQCLHTCAGAACRAAGTSGDFNRAHAPGCRSIDSTACLVQYRAATLVAMTATVTCRRHHSIARLQPSYYSRSSTVCTCALLCRLDS